MRTGHGACKPQLEPSNTSSLSSSGSPECECAVGWGDVGCNIPVEQLSRAKPVNLMIGVGEWAYFSVEVSLALEAGATSKHLASSWVFRPHGAGVL
jgi:hypothetical protein